MNFAVILRTTFFLLPYTGKQSVFWHVEQYLSDRASILESPRRFLRINFTRRLVFTNKHIWQSLLHFLKYLNCYRIIRKISIIYSVGMYVVFVRPLTACLYHFSKTRSKLLRMIGSNLNEKFITVKTDH